MTENSMSDQTEKRGRGRHETGDHLRADVEKVDSHG
jgi:hypothetical protein